MTGDAASVNRDLIRDTERDNERTRQLHPLQIALLKFRYLQANPQLYKLTDSETHTDSPGDGVHGDVESAAEDVTLPQLRDVLLHYVEVLLGGGPGNPLG